MTTPVSKSGIEAGDEGTTARAGAGGTKSALCAPGKTSRGRRCTDRRPVPRVGISRDELQSRIAAPAELTAIELIDTLEELHRMQAMLEERKLSLTTTLVDQIAAEYKQVGGWSSTALDVAESEVSVALVMNRYNAGKHIGIATALRDRLPRVRDALASGSVDLARAHQINNATCNVSDDLIDEVERQAMRKIIPDPASPRSGLTGKRLTNAIGRIVNKLDPDGVRERRAARRGERYVGVGKDEDGMSYLHGSLPAADAQKLDGRLREMAGGPCDRDGRNFDQRRADSLIALVDGRAFLPCDCDRADCPRRSAPLTTPRKPLVHVIMLKETLDGTSDEPAFLDGYGIVDAAYACEIARDAHTVTVKLPEDVRRRLSVPAAPSHREQADPSPPSESSAPLPDSAFTYRPGSVLATWVRILGGMCRWPHCDAAAWNADLDHTEPFNHRSPENGGATTANGLKPYCRHHHGSSIPDTGGKYRHTTEASSSSHAPDPPTPQPIPAFSTCSTSIPIGLPTTPRRPPRKHRPPQSQTMPPPAPTRNSIRRHPKLKRNRKLQTRRTMRRRPGAASGEPGSRTGRHGSGPSAGGSTREEWCDTGNPSRGGSAGCGCSTVVPR